MSQNILNSTCQFLKIEHNLKLERKVLMIIVPFVSDSEIVQVFHREEGYLVYRHMLDTLLSHGVPQYLSERYAVRFIDDIRSKAHITTHCLYYDMKYRAMMNEVTARVMGIFPPI